MTPQPVTRVDIPVKITAADSETRIIEGRIVTWNEQGNTSAGATKFLQGSITIPNDVKLLLEHDHRRPIGRMIAHTVTDTGIDATFKIAATTTGNDSIVEAMDNLRDGFSVGVEVANWNNKNGVMVVSSSDLIETSLVAEPAIRSARVDRVAATENSEANEPTEQPESEEPMADTTEATKTEEVVEAAHVQSVVTATTPVAFTTPRSPIINAESYLEHSVKAAMGSEDSRQYVRAADDSTSTNTGLTLPGHLQTFVSTSFNGIRPAIDAVTSQALPPAGMSFTIPKLGTAPTVAETSEGAAPSETGMTSTYDTVTVKKYSGLNRVSFELLDRSSPAFYSILIDELRRAYAVATDSAMIAAFTASGTQASTTAATSAGLQSFISTQAAAAYKGTGGDYARNLVASTDVWAAIMGFADTTGRSLYTAAAPMNAQGQATPTSIVGNVLGTNLYVDHNITVSGVIDESMFLVAPSSVMWWESPTTELRVNALTTGEVEINLYGYGAIGVLKGGAGVRRFNLT